MRKTTKLLCVSMLTLLSACATPDDGYYDKNGNWIAYNRYNETAHPHAPLPGGTDNRTDRTYYNDNGNGNGTTTVTTTTYSYDRPGYYDRNGYYSTMRGVRAPDDMLPPTGMCRVWFPNRAPEDQPGIESCSGIQGRIPAGAYVVYGG